MIYQGKFSTTQISCFGHNNILETFYYNCLIPRKHKPFTLSKKLTCRQLYWTGFEEDNYSEQTKKYTYISSRKMDHVTFTISVDAKAKKLYRSNTGGEVALGAFSIFSDDQNQISALRKVPLGKPFFSTAYEQITILKSSGKGMMQYHNTNDALGNSENLNSIIFQCE